MDRERDVAYVRTERDMITHHITRLAGDDVRAGRNQAAAHALQRSGHLSRAEMIQLQANYLRDVS